MPSKRNTPPEKKRAPRGSRAGVLAPIRMGPDDYAALAHLCEVWQCGQSEAVRRALREAALRAEHLRLQEEKP